MDQDDGERKLPRHSYRAYRRHVTADGQERIEVLCDFSSIGRQELEHLRRQSGLLSGPNLVIEIDGQQVSTAEAVAHGGQHSVSSPSFEHSLRHEVIAPEYQHIRGAQVPPGARRVVTGLELAEARIWGVYERLVFAAEESMRRTQKLTEMAVAQHEYMSEELRRLRGEYEEEFSIERNVLRRLRAAWLERVCDDEAKFEDVARFIAEQFNAWNGRSKPSNGAANAPGADEPPTGSSSSESASSTA